MNEYTSVDNEKLVFDDNGNLLRDDKWLYQYDYNNRLVEVELDYDHSNPPAGTVLKSVKFEYDILGRRITKKKVWMTDGVAIPGYTGTRYFSDGTEELEETSLDGTQLKKRYTYGTTIDEVCQVEVFTGDNPGTYYYHSNHQGTIYTITDSDGYIFEQYEYDEYGNIRSIKDGETNEIDGSQIGNEYMFQGRRYDPETGFYYYRARFYDPQKGRFITRDPKGYVDGLNMYAFVSNNPVNMVDPRGTEEDDDNDDVDLSILEGDELEEYFQKQIDIMENPFDRPIDIEDLDLETLRVICQMKVHS
ncbi:hypothetical protein GF366_02825 [Candidatus Peregrinibacteria bacterium]|nr:hypothetical protein [Candidatus Peregrinibacteria bacterium]